MSHARDVGPKSLKGDVRHRNNCVCLHQKRFLVNHNHTFYCTLSSVPSFYLNGRALTHLTMKSVVSVVGQMEQMFTAFPPDVAGNLDYKNLVHIITHGEEKDQE